MDTSEQRKLHIRILARVRHDNVIEATFRTGPHAGALVSHGTLVLPADGFHEIKNLIVAGLMQESDISADLSVEFTYDAVLEAEHRERFRQMKKSENECDQ